MALLVLMPGRNTDTLVARMRSLRPNLDIRVWPEIGNTSDIEFIVTWNHSPGELKKYPNLRGISSYGAGVDHILRDPELPEGIPIARVVDQKLIHEVSQYAVSAVLNQKRHWEGYRENQRKKKWRPIPMAKTDAIGILGLGQIGQTTARAFVKLGFHVYGWDRAPKKIQSVHCFHGEAQFAQLLSVVDYLICSLPLTPSTKNILNKKTFRRLKQGAYVINMGRGDHLVEEDLLEAIEEGHISGACLDVFRMEPLPQGHPFWNHPKITVTPHIAGITDPDAVAGQLLKNYRRMQKGLPPLNTINRQRGF